MSELLLVRRAAIAIGGVAMVLAASVLAAGAPQAPIVRTAKGAVRGFYAGDIAQFRGIPFAAPPIGPLRWRPPAAAASWKGVRDATRFGPSCAQSTTLGVFAGPTSNDEDCLYLNLYAPRSALVAGRKLPVIVWIFGGGMVNGASDGYDGSLLAREGAIVVTINYRLNLMGFLAHPALDAEGHLFGNYGFLDQQAALRWVRDNIAGFGGDPGRVTLSGQSAGGTSLAFQMISPLARGLFQRGILMSGQSYWTSTPLQTAQARGVALAVAAGCGSGADAATAECLRKIPAATIEKFANPSAGAAAFTVVSILDGQILPSAGNTAFRAGQFNHVPLMVGNTEDEGNFFMAVQQYSPDGAHRTITDSDVTAFVAGTYGRSGLAPKVLELYPANRYPSAQQRLSAIRTDPFACRVHRADRVLVGKVPIYSYEFRDRTAPGYFPAMPGFVPLADHTSDLQYVFGGWHGGDKGIARPLDAEQARLSAAMVKTWVDFARTGNPNGAGNAPWPAYVEDKNASVMLAQQPGGFTTFTTADFEARHKCQLWEAQPDG